MREFANICLQWFCFLFRYFVISGFLFLVICFVISILGTVLSDTVFAFIRASQGGGSE